MAWVTFNPVVHGLIVLIVGFLAVWIITWILKNWMRHLVKRTKATWDDMLLSKSQKPIIFFVTLLVLKKAVRIMTADPGHIAMSDQIIHSLLIFTAAYLIVISIDLILEHWGSVFARRTKSELDDNLLALGHKFAMVIIYVMALLFVLEQWGVDAGKLFTTLGIAGIAVAFALQESLGNVFGGISLILDNTIRKGDVIELDDGTTGRVMDVGIRSTKIKTWDNEEIIVPNGKLSNSKIKNLIKPTKQIRVVVNFGVEYGTKVEKVKKVVLPVVKKIKNTLKDPSPSVDFLEMADFSLNFRAVVWVEDYSKRWDTKLALTDAIHNVLNKNKIGIPFPTQTLHVKK